MWNKFRKYKCLFYSNNRKIQSIQIFRLFLFALLNIVATETNGLSADSPPLVREFKGYKVYVADGPGEPLTWGTYSVRVLKDISPFFIDGLIKFRNGAIAGWWLTDMNGDSHPEIIVWIRSGGSGAGGELDIYEFDGKKLHESHIPVPPKELLDGHRGADVYAVENDAIVWMFPKYGPDDSNANPTGGSTVIRYIFKEQKWVRSNKPLQISPRPRSGR